MGFRLTWLKITGKTRDDILAILDVVSTGEQVSSAGEGLSGRLCLDGSYLFVASEDQARHLDPRLLAALSKECEILACHVHEGCMTSFAAGWRDGREVWHFTHDSDKGTLHLDVAGTPPAELSRIRIAHETAQETEMERLQKAPAREASSVDASSWLPPDLAAYLKQSGSVAPPPPPSFSMGANHMFDVPVALCEAIVGLRHDQAGFWDAGLVESLAPAARLLG